MPWYAYVHLRNTHLYNWSTLSSYSRTATFNRFYSELMPYTVLTYCYWVSFHDAYQCQGHAHYWYWLQLPYNSWKIYLTNHMGSISYHIMPLVITSLRYGHTHTHKHTLTIRTGSILRNQASASLWPARSWFKMSLE